MSTIANNPLASDCAYCDKPESDPVHAMLGEDVAEEHWFKPRIDTAEALVALIDRGLVTAATWDMHPIVALTIEQAVAVRHFLSRGAGR